MRSEALVLYFTLLQIAGAGFPEDSEPISISHGNCKCFFPCFSLFSLGYYLFSCAQSILSLEVVSLLSLFSLFVLYFRTLHSQYVSHLVSLFTLPTPSQLVLPLQHLPSPQNWTPSAGLECKLAPKDGPYTWTKIKDLRQHLKLSPPHMIG